jgi:hypothetical protein
MTSAPFAAFAYIPRLTMSAIARALLALALPLALAGCDMLGIESASEQSARRESEGKAIGGACRYSGRTIEECYAQNKKSDKAAVFSGWREMNDYMRENKMETPPEVLRKAAEKPADKAADKAAEGEAAAGGEKAKSKSNEAGH